MKAISLWQPYASLIAFGSKSYETRHWSPPDSLIGQRIAIHAAKRKITKSEYDYWQDCEDDSYQGIDHEMRMEFKIACDVDWRKKLPYGAVVATAKLIAVWKVTFEECPKPNWVACEGVFINLRGGYIKRVKNVPISVDEFGDYSFGRYLWELNDIEVLTPPVPAIGRQGIWNWNE